MLIALKERVALTRSASPSIKVSNVNRSTSTMRRVHQYVVRAVLAGLFRHQAALYSPVGRQGVQPLPAQPPEKPT